MPATTATTAPLPASSHRRALTHPAFLGALALLVVNDHVLKGAGLLPGWVTGKLSDLAGVVVAPVVLGALVRARSRRAKLAVHLAVALGMIATELSQPTADVLAAGLRSVGLTGARLVADPSDLWALVLLPVPYVLLTPGATMRGVALPRVSLAFAALACVASPQPPPRVSTWTTSAYVVNATTTQEDVRIAWTAALPDCAALTALPAGITLDRVVRPDLFGDAVTFRLDPGETVPLEEVDARAAVGRFRGDAGTRDGGVGLAASASCQLARVSADGVPDTIVLFSTSFVANVPITVGEPPSPEVAVQLHETGNERSWTIGSMIGAAEASDLAVPTTCRTQRPLLAVGGPGADGTLTSIDTLPDGCLDITVDDVSGAAVSHYVCGVPREMLPFTVGESLRLRPTGGGIEISSELGSDLQVSPVQDGAATLARSVTVTAGGLESCNGERIACGAFVVPVGATLSPGGGTPDARGIVPAGSASAFIGRSEHVLLAVPGCEGARDRPGIHTQLAISRLPS
ncbi:MAG: hypothetical protein U0234_01375 [Sandaracinus sp.]